MNTPSTPKQIALAYHRAWTSRDMDAAMDFVTEDVVCDGPAGRLTGAAALRNGLTREEIRAVLLQVGVYAGVPAANRAFAVAQRVLAEIPED